MPKHKLHRYAAKILLGKAYPEVDSAIDQPYIFLGRKHRKMFHSPKEACALGYLAAGSHGGGLAGLVHVWVDEECSKDPVFRRWLQYSSKQHDLLEKDIRRQKKRNRKTRKTR